MIGALGIKDGDDVDFFKFSGKSFLFAKKADVVELLTKLQQGQNIQAPPVQSMSSNAEIDAKELSLLQKLDTMRYNDRTKDKVNAMLSQEERQILMNLLKKKFVGLFKKATEQEYKYGIAKNIYDTFLYGKRPKTTAPQAAGQGPAAARAAVPVVPASSTKVVEAPKPKQWEQKLSSGSAYTSLLESKGFVVLQTEADASSLSAAMEESIRRGLVLGTRAFNRRFYIATRSFIGKNAPIIMGVISEKAKSVDEISKETGIEEDGIRAVLYIMSESGDVTEMRRDIFKMA